MLLLVDVPCPVERHLAGAEGHEQGALPLAQLPLQLVLLPLHLFSVGDLLELAVSHPNATDWRAAGFVSALAHTAPADLAARRTQRGFLVARLPFPFFLSGFLTADTPIGVVVRVRMTPVVTGHVYSLCVDVALVRSLLSAYILPVGPQLCVGLEVNATGADRGVPAFFMHIDADHHLLGAILEALEGPLPLVGLGLGRD